MSSSLVITLKMNRAQGDLTRYKLDTTVPRQEALALKTLFERLASGLETASFDVQTASAAPVRASSTITLSYSDISNSDTVTVFGTALTCVTGTPSGAQFKKVTDGPTTATNLAALINSNTTTNKLGYATAAAGVVTVQALVPGVIGNKLTLATSNATGFVLSAATLASGAGGTETAVVNYSRGL